MRANKPGFLFGLLFVIFGLGSKVRPFLAMACSPGLAGQVGFSAALTVCTGGPIIGFSSPFSVIFSPFLGYYG